MCWYLRGNGGEDEQAYNDIHGARGHRNEVRHHVALQAAKPVSEPE